MCKHRLYLRVQSIKPNARASQTGASLVVSADLETEEEAVMVGLPKMETRLRDVLLQHQG